MHPRSTPTRVPRWGPRWLRCSSLKYSRYSRSSRLAIGAPRPSRCDARLSPRAVYLRQRLFTVLQALGNFRERIARVLELDVRRQVPFVFLQKLQNVLDRRVSLTPRRIAAAVGRLLLVLEVQVRDARVVLPDERNGVVARFGVVPDVELRRIVFRGGDERAEAVRRRDFIGFRRIGVTVESEHTMVFVDDAG